jgi:peptidoglycan/xylan/chitin deacetylase (PgdA/CDA1 family)
MGHALKARVERALSSDAAGRMTRHRIRGKRLILAYHGIVPEGETPAGERSLFVNHRDFAEHLDIVAETADVVALDAIDVPGDARPRVAITFDDAYRGAVNEGIQELATRGLPATIFVAPGRLNNHVFWWDSLADGSAVLDEAIRNQALHGLGGSDEQVRSWAARIRLPSSDALPGYAQTATHAELRNALEFSGITVGSHSWSHANLAALGPSELAAELERSRDWLQAAFGEKAIPWLAYPYGIDSEEVHRAAAKAGYVGAMRIGGGWHRTIDVPRLARPRLNVPGSLTVAGFRARLLGVMRP